MLSISFLSGVGVSSWMRALLRTGVTPLNANVEPSWLEESGARGGGGGIEEPAKLRGSIGVGSREDSPEDAKSAGETI
jgi:hypothetical protein